MSREKELVTWAKSAAKMARPHLSNYHVGAAILANDNNIYIGANIEFDNFTNTMHAEEVALSAMIMGGATKPLGIAVYTQSALVPLWAVSAISL